MKNCNPWRTAGYGVVASCLASTMVFPASFTWTGFGFFSDNFSESGNWFEDAVPVSGDSCSFRRGSSSGIAVFDLTPTRRYSSVKFIGPFEIGGGRFGADFLSVSGKVNPTIHGQGNVTLSGGLSTRVVPSRIELAFGGRLAINGMDVESPTTFCVMEDRRVSDVPGSGLPAVIEVNGGISGSGGIFIERMPAGSSGSESPDSHVAFSRANTFTGLLSVKPDGILRITNGAGLGSPSVGTSVERGGSLWIDASVPITVPEPLLLEGEIRTVPFIGANNGEVTMSGKLMPTVCDWIVGSPLRITGAVENPTFGGGAGITFTPLGTLDSHERVTLSGNDPNTMARPLLSSVDLFLEKPNGVAAVAGNLAMKDDATAHWTRSEQILDSSDLILNFGHADLEDENETVAKLILMGDSTLRTDTAGSLRINDRVETALLHIKTARIDGRLKLGRSDLPIILRHFDRNRPPAIIIGAEVSAAVTGASMDLRATGELRLDGVSLVPVKLSGATLDVVSDSRTMPVQIEGGTLAGTGRVGAVTIGSGECRLEPGRFKVLGEGTNNVGARETGILTTGNIVMSGFTEGGNGGTIFLLEIYGTAPGTEHDQIQVFGSVNLNGAVLAPFAFDLVNRVPLNVAGKSFTIISNDGTDPVVGTFKDLPQGARIGNFVISYTGGSGNDVVLLGVSTPSGLTRTWTGQGSNANWSTSANWSPAGAPQAGDALVFPSGGARRTNTNDLTDLDLDKISITGGPYVINGNAITLGNGISVTGPVLLSHTVNLGLRLSAEQTFSIGPHFLNLNGAIDTNGVPLAFHTEGSPGISAITCNGVISEGVSAQFTKTGGGMLTLTSANTTRGNFHIRQGVARITNSAALGSRLGETIVDAGAQLNVGGVDLAINETIRLAGTIVISDNTGTPGFGDPIECASTARLSVSAVGVTQVNIFDEITGESLTKTGAGTLNLGGAKQKSLSGGFIIDEGRVVVTGTAGVILLPGDTTVGVDPARSAVLEIKQRRVTEVDSRLIVNQGGMVICDSPEISFAGIVMQGGLITTDGNGFSLNGPLVTLPSAISAVISGRLTLGGGVSEWNIQDGAASPDLLVSAVLRENVQTDAVLRKLGSGGVIFTGANTIDTAQFLDGVNTWNGTSNVTKLNVIGGSLSGTGRSDSLSALTSGTISPGTGPGLFTAGTLTLGESGKLFMELNGSSPGTGYDQIRCTADTAVVDLARGQLMLSQGFIPALGSVLTLIDVQGTGFPSPFGSLPEGATVVAGTQRYRISYRGGTGNDVTLTALSQFPLMRLSVSALSIRDDFPSQGMRTLSATVGGGAGAAGMPIAMEVSTNLQDWSVFPIRIADGNGNLDFIHSVRIDRTPKLFFRAKVP